jgi:hypothetical protein
MGANDFSKEEKVAFDQILQGFEDALTTLEMMDVLTLDQQQMERARDTMWFPQPYIALSFDGMDQTGNAKRYTQLSVPATIDRSKSVPYDLDALELRDFLQEDRLKEAAYQKLASDVNVACLDVATKQGTLVVTKSSAASEFGDIAAIENVMNRNGVQGYSRQLALSTADYNGLAKDLANRSTMTEISVKAYREAYVGRVASFETVKLDYSLRCPAAAGGAGLTIGTRVADANYHVPKATSVAAGGEASNFDNRRQRVTISSTTGVVAGDSFTIAAVNEVHHITKLDTGSLKTFRVISVDSATTMTISPPIISGQGGSDAEAQYQNCVVNTAASNSAIVFLNTQAKPYNPFWQKGAIAVLPGRYAVPENAGAAVMRGTTKGGKGLEVTMTKQYNAQTMKTFIRSDVRWGVVMLQPQMSGIALFSQS